MTETEVLPRTRSAILASPGVFHHASVPERPLAPDEVRIRLEGCGVCGSDLAVWKGTPRFNYPLAPGSPGHEGWGRIEAIGSEVIGFKAGDRVAALSSHAYAEQDVAKASQVVKLPEDFHVPYFPAAPLGCAMNIFERSDIRSGMNVAIVGIGFLGVILTRLCVEAGAMVIAISRRPHALELARQAGAKHVISLQADSVVRQVISLTCAGGCDVVIETKGSAESLDLAAQMVTERGRLVIAGSFQEGPHQPNMQLRNGRGRAVINGHGRDPQRCLDGITAAVAAVRRGVLDLTELVEVFPLTEIEEAFHLTETRPPGFVKAVVVPS